MRNEEHVLKKACCMIIKRERLRVLWYDVKLPPCQTLDGSVAVRSGHRQTGVLVLQCVAGASQFYWGDRQAPRSIEMDTGDVFAV